MASLSTNERKKIGAYVGRLLSHYWTANEPAQMRAVQIADWIADLEEFGADVTIEACALWRISESRRPTPADIRKLAVGVARERAHQAALEGPDTHAQRAARQRTKDQRQLQRTGDQREGRDIVNRWAQERGYADLDAYCAATGQHWTAAYAEVIQGICGASPYPAQIGSFRLLASAIGGGGRPAPPREPAHTASALGVTAREFSAEELAAGRRALGLETPPQ